MKSIIDPINELIECHKEISNQLNGMEIALEKFRKNGNIDDMRLYLDGFFLFIKTTLSLHIRDEEEALFPFLKVKNYLNNEINNILNDHKDLHASVEILKLLKEMSSKTHSEIENRVAGIIEIMRDHIQKEENVIYKMAREKLTPEQLAEVSRKMEWFRK